ncbi:patatin-like phospholipase family protein [Rufibacter sp. LB8]|uniref:patatin-like phospholipase family protein n=1 Tax=Rufibacter sp. LB8 TaxID=2777781 RepID=UPI00178C44C3|nr:patatin-like phospholipase family protein [Rufibacter sp. LB8]
MARIGLCLSGGAARGIAHLGVMKALQELGVKVDVISGVSSGAIAGAFVAAGYTPDQVLEIATDVSVTRFLKPAFNRGVLQNQALRSIFTEYLQEKTFADVSGKLIISALDLVEASTVYFTEGLLADALMASSAVPVLFKPVAQGSRMLVDGGLINNLPVECLQGECDQIIGVHVNPIHHQAEIGSIRNVTERVFHLALNANVRERMALCHLYLEPPLLKHYHIYALPKAKEIFEIGYEHTLSLSEEILNISQR